MFENASLTEKVTGLDRIFQTFLKGLTGFRETGLARTAECLAIFVIEDCKRSWRERVFQSKRYYDGTEHLAAFAIGIGTGTVCLTDADNRQSAVNRLLRRQAGFQYGCDVGFQPSCKRD